MQRIFGRIAGISLFILSAAVLSLGAWGQAVVADRIVQPIDDAAITTLKGNVHPLAIAKYDLGAAPASQPMNHMQLVLQRSAAQEAALEAFLAATQVKGSPEYHKWLTPQQFGALYGPSDADVQKLTTWLNNAGFTVNRVSNGRTFIDFTGSVAQVQNAFHTAIHLYQANGVSFAANASNPTIPSALAPVVTGIAHLNTFPFIPQHVKGVGAKFDSQQHRFVPSSSKLNPNYTAQLNGPYLVTVPADAATIYDTPNSFNSKFSGGTSYTGTGVTIGIMGQSAIDPTLVQNYRNLFVGDQKAPIITNIDGVGDSPGDDGESYLDNEIAGGLAPGATIHFYTASATVDDGVLTSAEVAIDDDNTVDILSMSYGACELFNTTVGNAQINAMWQQAAAQGITVLVSTGDSGSAGCDNPNTENDAVGPLAVNGLGSTPYNIAVGGTDYDVLIGNSGSDFSKYVSTNTGSAATFYRSALGYIPEATWNDSTLQNGTVANNVPLIALPQYFSEDSIAAGSGGPSNCSVNSTTQSTLGTCTSGYPKPSWQTGIGVPNDQARDIPDVSLLAGDGFYTANWAVCDNSPNGFDADGNGGTANCIADSTGDFFTNGYGGTSAATPAFAGIMALIVQKTGERQGQAAPILYSLAQSMPSVFHDVTVGNNSVSCIQTASTTATCIVNSQGYTFESGFNTFTGYDLATGLGSVDATLLVNNWTSAAGSLLVANVAATPSATSITTADPLTFTVNVTSLATGGATPAGTVSVTDGIYTSPAPVALVNGSATITIPANSLAANPADQFTISYAPPSSGAVYANASTFVTVAVAQAATPAIALSGANITVVEGASGTSTISVTPSGGFTGAVNLTCLVTGPANATSVPTCALTPPAVTIAGTAASTSTLTVTTTATTTVGAYTVTVSGADAATGKVTASTPIMLTVNSASTPGLGVSGTPIAIALPANTTGTSNLTISPSGGFTGAVNLTCSITSPGGATCAVTPTSVTITGTTAMTAALNVTILNTTAAGSYTVNVTAADAATGKVTATDPITLTVTGTGAAGTISFTPAPTTATVSSPGQSGTSTISVTSNYVGGKINFGFVLATAPSNANTTYNPACTAQQLTTVNGVATATATCTTTAPTSGALNYPQTHEKTRWYEGAGGAALACILFFGIPARRRGWRTMLSLLVALVTMAGVGCGGGGGGGGGGNGGTTTGTYTYTVTGTDAATSTITASGTVTVTVN